VPTLRLSPDSRDFADVLVGSQSAAQTFRAVNDGTAPVELTGVEIGGSNPGHFSIADDRCGPTTLAPGESCEIEVVFAPTATGVRSAVLRVVSDVADSPHMALLAGTGVAPEVGISPTSHGFGNVALGTTSPERRVTVRNTGSASLVVSASASGHTGEFQLDDECTPVGSVSPGDECTIGVVFAPTGTGARSMTLAVSTDDASEPITNVTFTGAGVAAPPASIRVVVDAMPNDAQDFAFTGALGDFLLDDDADATLPKRASYAGLAPGTYRIRQRGTPRWSLTTVSCTGGSVAVDLVAREATIRVAAGATVVCRFTSVRRRADAMIARRVVGPYARDDVYGSVPSPAQTLTRSNVAAGRTYRFFVLAQNDSLAPDRLTIRGTSIGSSSIQVRYFVGDRNVTASVRRGIWQTRNLAPGSSQRIRIEVWVPQSAGPADARVVAVMVDSSSRPGVRDVVRAIVAR
jgi:hypothetical protein